MTQSEPDLPPPPPPPPPPADPDRAAAVDQLVAEFVERLRVGLGPDPDQMLLDNPDLAGDLDAPLRAAYALHRRLSLRMPAPVGPFPGTVGRFQIRGVLGRGASSVVYRAFDPAAGREVALKVVPAGPGAAAARFARAARATAKLRHTHIVPVLESGEVDGFRYVALELVAGESLEDRLARGGWPDDRAAVALVRSVAEALAYAHRHGVVHRDVKPGNILLDERGEPSLTDFGLAREASDVTLTQDGHVLGTPAYMAPEQARGGGHAADGRADVYALGVVLYRLLTRRMPFEDCRTPAELAYRHALGPAPAPRTVRPGIPPGLDLIVRTATDPDPAHRLPTADAFAAELGRWLAGETLHLRPPTPVGRLWRWYRTQPRLSRRLLAAAAALLAVAPLAVWAGWNLHVTADLAGQRAELAAAQVRVEREARARTEAALILNRVWASYPAPNTGHRGRALQDANALLDLLRDVTDPDLRDQLTLEARSVVAASYAGPDVETLATFPLPPTGPWTWPVDVHPSGGWVAVLSPTGPVRFEPGKAAADPAGWQAPPPRPGVRFTPDGRFLLVTPTAGGLAVWDGEVTCKVAELIPPLGPAVLDVGVVQGGDRVVAALADGTVRGWTVTDWRPVPTGFTPGPPGPWVAARFGPAARLAVADRGGVITLLADGGSRPDTRGLAPGAVVTCLAWSPDGTVLAAGLSDGDVAVWEEAGGPPRLYRDLSYGPSVIQFSADGDFLFAGNLSQGTRAWHLATGEVLLRDLLAPSGFARDGRTFAGAMRDRVEVYRFLPSAVARRLPAPDGRVERLTWSGDGRRLAGLDARYGVVVWDARSGRPADTFRAPPGGFYPHNAAIALTPDGALLAYAGGGEFESRVLIRDVHARRTAGEWGLPGGYERLAAAPGGGFLLVREQFVGNTQVVETVAWDVRAERPPVRLGVVRPAEPGDARRFFDAQLTPDGRRYLWTGPRLPDGAARIEVRDVPSGRLVFRERIPDRFGSSELRARFGEAARSVWVATTGGGVEYDLAGGRVAGRTAAMPTQVPPGGGKLLLVPTTSIRSGPGVCYLPDGSVPSGIVFRWNHQATVEEPSVSPDGRFLAYPCGPSAVAVIDLPEALRLVDSHLVTSQR